MLFRDWLKAKRAEAGLSQAGLALALQEYRKQPGRGRHPKVGGKKTVGSWEQFNRASEQYSRLLASFFGVSLEDVRAGMTHCKRGTVPKWPAGEAAP